MGLLNTSISSRTGLRMTFTRVLIVGGVLAIIACFYWFMLPVIQFLIRPEVRGGDNGPWLVRPDVAFRFGAMAIMTAVTIPVIMRPIHEALFLEDKQSGVNRAVALNREAKNAGLIVKGAILITIYAAGFVFYLFSWTIFSADGIDERLMWKTLNHEFEDIESLETISEGNRSESLAQNGPWYAIRLKNGRTISLSLENEGSKANHLHSIAAFVADRAELTWNERSDSRAR